MGRITQYFRDTRAELRHVAWPTQTQTIVYTALVIGISVFVAAYLGFFDFVFTGALGKVLANSPVGNSAPMTEVATTSPTQMQITPTTTPIQ